MTYVSLWNALLCVSSPQKMGTPTPRLMEQETRVQIAIWQAEKKKKLIWGLKKIDCESISPSLTKRRGAPSASPKGPGAPWRKNEWESEHGALNGKSDLICAGVPQSNETKSPPCVRYKIRTSGPRLHYETRSRQDGELRLWPVEDLAELAGVDELVLVALRVRQPVRHAVREQDLLGAVGKVCLDLSHRDHQRDGSAIQKQK